MFNKRFKIKYIFIFISILAIFTAVQKYNAGYSGKQHKQIF